MAIAELVREAQHSTESRRPAEQRFLLRDVDWKAYRQISDALEGRHLRFTYDRGNLEFMDISSTHANCSRLLGRLVIALTEELALPIRSLGDMTCDREDLERGLEPDECFYVENESRVRGKKRINLATDPPPDLAIEVDITSSSLRRMDIYAAIGVPEVWRYDETSLIVYRRQEDGSYAESEHSQHFLDTPVSQIATFLNRRDQMDENSLVREFRTWIRDVISGQT